MPAARRGRFIVFEGGEGAGKSTQLACLSRRLHAAGVPHKVTREPGGSDVGRYIRTMLLHAAPADGIPAKAEALLFAADRAAHVEQVIRPVLDNGDVVLCDRYEDSSIAYQGAAAGLSRAAVAGLSRWATGGLRPDLVVLLDIAPAVGLARVAGRGAPDRMERQTPRFHARVRAAFLARAAADPRRYLTLDGAAPAEQLAADVADRVEDLLDQCLPDVKEGR